MSRILRPHRYQRLLVHFSCVAIVMFLILAIHDYRMSSDESVRYFRRNISIEFPKHGKDSFGGRQRRTNGNNTSRIQENDFLDHANGSYREHLNLIIGTNLSEILSEIHTFLFKKIRLKISSGKWRPFCLGLNVLIVHFSCHWLCTVGCLTSHFQYTIHVFNLQVVIVKRKNRKE